jgi:hypothetical protein
MSFKMFFIRRNFVLCNKEIYDYKSYMTICMTLVINYYFGPYV